MKRIARISIKRIVVPRIARGRIDRMSDEFDGLDARAIAVELLERQFARGGIRGTLPSGKRADLEPHRERLLAIIGDGSAEPYVLLDAAVGLAILGDAAAIPTLRRVFDGTGFALTASCNEQGYAALGVALLDDTDSIDRIRTCARVNFAGIARPIALAILEGRELELPR